MPVIFPGIQFSGRQNASLQFFRMMGIIVDIDVSVRVDLVIEPAEHTGVGLKSFSNFLLRQGPVSTLRM